VSEDATTGETRDDDDEPGGDLEPELLHGVAVAHSGDQVTLHPGRHEYRALVEELRSDGYWVCTDLCGVDYLTYAAPRNLPAGVAEGRYEVVVGLLDPTERRRIRVRVQIPGDDPSIESITSVHPAADSHEREAWDLFGITFEGHPHLCRILLPDDWQGHPLRKDSPVGEIPVQFKATRELRS
jgi:NADH-quinone oxidoreductase subunit C